MWAVLPLVLVLAAGAAEAASSALTTHNGARSSPITTGLLKSYLDHFIPAASPKLLVFSQCFGGGFAEAGPFNQDPNTAVAAGAAADQYGIYGGYNDDAARALKPEAGRTGATVHQAGMDGRIEDPDYPESSNVGGGLALDQFSLAPVTDAGPVRSRHIVVYAGIPQEKNVFDPATNTPILDANGARVRTGDALDRDAIKTAFAGQPRTSVTSVGGEPAERNPGAGQNGWDFPADSNGLAMALRKVQAEIAASGNPAANEQFILFVGDHGTRLGTGDDGFGFPKDCEPAGARCELITLPGLGADAALGGFLDPLSRPGFEVVLPYDGMNVPLVFDADWRYVPFNPPGTFALEIATPGGTPLVLDAFEEHYAEIDDGVLGNLPGEGLSLFFPVPHALFHRQLVGTPLALTLVNEAAFPIRVSDAWVTAGPSARGSFGCTTLAGCRTQLAHVLPPTDVADRAVRRTARQLGRLGRRADALLARIEGASGKRRTRLARRLERLVGRLLSKAAAAERRGRLGTPLAALRVAADGIDETLAGGDAAGTTTTTTTLAPGPTTTTTTLPAGRALLGPGDAHTCLARISGGCVAGIHVPFCASVHLHQTIAVDGGAPIGDPDAGGCGHGEVAAAAGCGPDAVPDCP